MEVAHRQREQLPCQEVERLPVKPHRRAAQHVALQEIRPDHQDEDDGHARQQRVEQAPVERPFHQAVDEHLCEDRQRHLQAGGDQREHAGERECARERAEELHEPEHLGLGERRLLEPRPVGEQNRVARPLGLELRALHPDETA